MTTDAWQDLGDAIRQARLKEGWSLARLAAEALGNGDRKGYVSQVEKGRRNLSPETIDKFVQALSLPEDIVRAAHLAPPPDPKAKVTANVALPSSDKPVEDVDLDVERLLSQIDQDATHPKVAEDLLTALVYKIAEGKYQDLQTAYVALRNALEAAEDIRKRGKMPVGNADDQLAAVMAEVAKLTDQGQLEEANDLLDAEERRMRADHEALEERMAEARRQMLAQRLNQDRLRNDPEAAAKRLIADVRQQPDRGKLFWAINQLCHEWRDEGVRTGDIFALRVALQIARANYGSYKTKRALSAAALHNIGLCYLSLAQRSTRSRDLELAHNALKAALDKTSKSKEPSSWAARQDGYGRVLQEMGARENDPDLLREAVTAHRAALDAISEENTAKWYSNSLGNALQKLGAVTQDSAPLSEAVNALRTALSLRDEFLEPTEWVRAQSNLSLALRWKATLTDNLNLLDKALEGYRVCEALEIREEAAFDWAMLQWNIADLAVARFELDADPAYLDEAVTYVRRAREVFAEGSDYQTQRCDDLLEKVAEARARLPG